MNTFINYLIEANLSLIFCLLIYWSLLDRENQFALKRIYLLAALVFSVIVPLVHFNTPISNSLIPSVNQVIPTEWLPSLTIYAGEKITNSPVSTFNSGNVLLTFYSCAVLVFSVLFLSQIGKLVSLLAKSKKYMWGKCKVVESNEEKSTFSFFNFIFIGQAHLLNAQEKEEILLHESVHVEQRHSIDIILLNLLGIVFWFNPIIKIYKKELIQLHEFEADSKSTQNKDIDHYCGLLIKVALQKVHYPIANHFNQSLTIKRITMMKTMKQKIKAWKTGTTLAATILLLIVVACQEQIGRNEALSEQQVKELSPEIQSQLNRAKLESPKSNFLLLEFNSGHEIDLYREANPKVYFYLISTGNKDYAIVEPNGIFQQIPKNESEVFSVVDEMATPHFGIESYYQNIAYTLQYPEEARKKGIEGKVLLEFVVQTDGSISDLKVKEGVYESLDTEALRAVYQLNDKWKPAIHQGQIVKQKLVMPVIFKLG